MDGNGDSVVSDRDSDGNSGMSNFNVNGNSSANNANSDFGTEEIRYEQHEVWFEDERSYNAKMQVVKEFGLAGISIWNLMSYTPVLLESVTENFVIAKVF